MSDLLSNAVKCSPTGGAIAVTTAVEQAGVHLAVRDHGMGIQGTRLGLPIVRRIVVPHGGRVWAESEARRGSVFHVLLPLAAADRAVQA